MNNYYEHFNNFWIPIYRKQVLDAKYNNDTELLNCIYENINKNWNLKEYKIIIFKKLGIEYIDKNEIIIRNYFKNKFKNH